MQIMTLQSRCSKLRQLSTRLANTRMERAHSYHMLQFRIHIRQISASHPKFALAAVCVPSESLHVRVERENAQEDLDEHRVSAIKYGRFATSVC